ncbi:MAG: bifunctional methylenetetrahydrofolate dehydrogenase/methenyltetrahydrofolate cyclohydrolase [Candidatus Acididesulfobacter diazotrophicus]|jgi:methylenetetrahydrofolate dehydrogenase (NADP+)/methenyltetrahydrofolate cyclohydrolase|uniref:Bifunctional protein FolD n=1 Tax=Candidatus Acididesulfobacter diazotrophicus TaxID=2597226 RepID=A0A519BPN6_9DELT|nr:MAG: bifunctional methylenetetrahydrofolate dehydrogenase/methenyltetrahydrofolate cyclohydrolase [Candidatus Acididesulfobacter diazotrophicus]
MTDTKIIDGKKIAADIELSLKEKIDYLKNNGIVPCIYVILIGDNPASVIYVRNKENAAKRCGILSEKIILPVDVSEDELLNKINELNDNPLVHGILVQLPVPPHIDENKIMETICVNKDVDGFHPFNEGKIFTGNSSFYPCTPFGIIKMLDYSNIELTGKNVIIVGQSIIVGKPLSIMLMNRYATVSVLNIYTGDIRRWTKMADILISATGKAHLIDDSFVKDGAVIIDVGITKLNGKICGDVNFDSVIEKVSKITPVPGGVGPVTVSVLMENTVNAAFKFL